MTNYSTLPLSVSWEEHINARFILEATSEP
jgi:hypothetical protein